MNRKRLELIQFSRALVPFLVMLFHLSVNMMDYYEFNLFGFSFIPISGGVNYFFALSGFMIYYVYHDRLNQHSLVGGFLLNRFIRIYPLYWLLTLVVLFIIFVYPDFAIGHEMDLDTMVTSLFLLQSPREHEPILLVAWSLVHTVFFYLMFSLLFFQRKYLSIGIMSLWTMVTVLYSLGFVYIDHYLFRFFFNEYNLIFLGGILSAYIVIHFKIHIKVAVLMVIVGIIGFPINWINSINPFIDISFDIGTGLSSLLIILGLASLDLQKDIKISKLFSYLGDAAFSIYLSHNVALDLGSEIFSALSVYEYLGGWLTSILLLIIMLAVGCFVHSYIEKPLVKQMKKLLIPNKKTIRTVSKTVS